MKIEIWMAGKYVEKSYDIIQKILKEQNCRFLDGFWTPDERYDGTSMLPNIEIYYMSADGMIEPMRLAGKIIDAIHENVDEDIDMLVEANGYSIASGNFDLA